MKDKHLTKNGLGKDNLQDQPRPGEPQPAITTLDAFLQDGKYFLSEKETSKFVSLSVHALRKRRSENKPPIYSKLESGTVRYALTDLMQWMQKDKRGTN